jgi:hypothetical protein
VRLVLVLAAVIGCSSPPRAADRALPAASAKQPTAKPPLGRVRGGVPICRHGKFERLEVDTAWPVVPSPPNSSVQIQGPLPSNNRNRWRVLYPSCRRRTTLGAPRSPTPGIEFCGRELEGVPGAYLLTCRNPQGEYDGPAELIAPDGSILAQGYCEQNRAIGAWVTWCNGRFHTLWSRGLKVRNDMSYFYNLEPPQ